jgi:ceramide glucosyltransferase
VNYLGLALLLLGGCSLLVVLVASALVAIDLSRPLRIGRTLPPITVLRPVKGVDEGFEQNLIALLEQRYPRFQLIIGAVDRDDPALAAARRVLVRFPQVDARIVAGADHFGLNPKVRNLNSMLRFARHEWILISDSNVRPSPDYLAVMAAELDDPSVRLVHNPIAGLDEGSLGDAFDHLHLATSIQGAVALARAARHHCVIGKSMLLHRADLERLGGLERVKDTLAEDYLIGRMYADAGLRIARSPYVVRSPPAGLSVLAFLARHLRWNQMRRRISPASYAAEALLNPIPFLIAAFPFHPLPALAGIATKCAADAAVTKRLDLRVLTVPLKDLLIFVAWILGALLTTVSWRGHRFTIGAGSVLVPYRAPRIFELDAALLLRIRRLERPLVTTIARASTRSGDAISWAIAGVVMLGIGARREALLLGVAALPATAFVQLMKRSIRRTRPDRVLVGFVALAENPDAFSFPSGHAATAFAVAAAFVAEPTVLAPMLWMHAGAIAASRVYLGAHYPLDVLAAAIIGSVAGTGARVVLG